MNIKLGLSGACRGFLLTFITLVPALSKAQDYHPLIRPNTYWDVYYSQMGPPPCYTWAHRFFFGGDTTINNTTYRKIYKYQILPVNPPDLCPPFVVDTIPWLSNIYMREDTLTRRVYVLDPSYDSIEQLQYDFSLEVGDTMFSPYAFVYSDYQIVSGVSTVTLENGELRKSIEFNFSFPFITESIGHGCGFFGTYVCNGNDWWQELNCVTENGIHLYVNGNSCAPFVGVSQPKARGFKIYPNPVSSNLIVETPSNCNYIMISTLTGRQLLQQEITGPTTNLNVSTLPSGIYLVKLQSDKGVQVAKFLKE